MTDNDDVMVSARDLVTHGFCVSGVRQWCDTYGFDFKTVLRDGISAKEGLATGDAMAIRAFELIVEKRDE